MSKEINMIVLEKLSDEQKKKIKILKHLTGEKTNAKAIKKLLDLVDLGVKL